MIDCDVHDNFVNGLDDLLPYMDPGYREYMRDAGWGGFALPTHPWSHPGGFTRKDAVPANGGPPGSDYELVREQVLDAHDVEYAILTGEEIISVSSLPHPQIAGALATAYNRWMIDEWLSRDKRLKGSLIVPTQDAERAASEIREVGNHPDIVQVLLPCAAPTGYGHPQFHPIYEAAVEMGLPVAWHPGGDGIGRNPPSTSTGHPTYYIEWHTLLCSVAMSHVVSLIAHGVFEKYPELRIVVIETGILWLPAVLWRLDGNWKALRAEVPWVKRLPSEVVHEHMRFTTQPLEEAPTVRQLRQALEAAGGLEDMLMFSSDYPHWNADNPQRVVRRLPPAWREAIMSENARSLYRLPERRSERRVDEAGVAS